MKFFLHHFFHNETNDRTEKGLVHVPKDKNEWPDAWKKIEYKHYSLFPQRPLSRADGHLFSEILSHRRSSEGSLQENIITESALSYLLLCGYGLQMREKEDRGREENRTVPSAGQRYPLEIYLLLFNDVEGLRSGVYHYAIKEHVLEPVVLSPFSQETKDSFSSLEWLSQVQGIICLTGVFDRTTRKYGSRGYRYILLEAGHVAQNILLAGTEKKINMIPSGGVNEEIIEKYIGLNTASERIVYVLSF